MQNAILVASLSFLLAFEAAPAAAQWIETSGPVGGAVTSLSVQPLNGHVFAVAGEGAYRSRDGGATWEPLFIGLPGDLAVSQIGAGSTVVYLSGVDPSGLRVFRSIDDGDTWTPAGGAGLPPGSIRAFYVSGSTVLVGCDGNGVYKSTDSGNQWFPSNTGMPANLTVGRFTTYGSDLYAGSLATSAVKGIYRSTDGGSTWTRTSFLFGGAGLVGLSASSAGIFAATNLPGVYRTTDNGASWDKIDPDITSATSVLATSSDLFIGADGVIYRADPNGNNWQITSAGLPAENLGGAIVSLAVSGINVLGGSSRFGVYRTTDAGGTWVHSSAGLHANRINGMLVAGPYAYVAADGLGFFRSADEGNHWSEIDDGIPPSAGWYGFSKAGATLLGGTGASSLYRSDDDGDHWMLSNSGLELSGTFAFVAEDSTVYAAGSSGVNKSIDVGVSWSPLTTGLTYSQTALDLWKDGPYMLVGTNDGLLRSTDAGDTWTAPYSGLPASGSFSAFAQVDSVVLAATSLGIYRSTDHGETWTSSNDGLGGIPSCLLVHGGDVFAGSSTGVYHSIDQGASWMPINGGFPSNFPIHKLAASEAYLFAGTLRHGVWRRPLSEATAVGAVRPPVTFALHQNRPNPFGSATRIGFSMARRSRVRLEVFTVAGDRVATLANGELEAGWHEVTWNGRTDRHGKAAPGVYLYRLTVNGASAVRKMVALQ